MMHLQAKEQRALLATTETRREATTDAPLEPSRRNQPCWHHDSYLLAPRTIREETTAVWSYRVSSDLLWQSFGTQGPNYEALSFSQYTQWETTGEEHDLRETTTAEEKGTHWRGETRQEASAAKRRGVISTEKTAGERGRQIWELRREGTIHFSACLKGREGKGEELRLTLGF